MENSANTIVRAGSRNDFHKNTFRCNINVSDICNFSCSYCINSASKNKSRRVLDKNILSGFIEDVAARECDKYFFGIAGGEPLIYPHVLFMLEKISHSIKTDDITVRFATNGSRLDTMEEKLYAAARRIHLQFSISVHMEQINIEQFISKITSFGHVADIKCKILLAPGKLAECKAILGRLADKNIDTILQVITRGGFQPLEYSDEELRFLDSHPTTHVKDIFHEYADGTCMEWDRITRNLNPDKINYKGMRCMAGAKALRLGPDGAVIPCFAATSAPVGGEWLYHLGDLRLKDIPELNRSRICPVGFCSSCLTFLKTPKWASPEASPSYLRAGR